MNNPLAFYRGIAMTVLVSLAASVPALAATFVYVSNDEDGDIATYRMQPDSGELQLGPRVKAGTTVMPMVVSPDRRYLYAAVRSKPYSVVAYSIDPATGALLGTVTTFALDGKTGLLTEMSSASALPPDTKLVPGAPRGAVGGPNAPPPRNTDNDIWAADIHMTPNGRFLYVSERTTSTLAAFSVNAETGKLTYVGSTVTEKQQRGFAIDPKGRFLIASGEKSETISTYAIDQGTGALRLIQKYPAGKGANWVEIVSFE